MDLTPLSYATSLLIGVQLPYVTGCLVDLASMSYVTCCHVDLDPLSYATCCYVDIAPLSYVTCCHVDLAPSSYDTRQGSSVACMFTFSLALWL